VVDESCMGEGKLGDLGVRNLRFWGRVMSAQKVGFEFPYHEFEIDTDVTVLVLGSSKSFLPVRVSILGVIFVVFSLLELFCIFPP